MRPTRPAPLFLALVPALAAAAALPAGASAAGFGEPRLVTPSGGWVDQPAVAVAPTGRVAVLWRSIERGGRRFRYRAAVGPSADGLGRAVELPAGRRAAGSLGDATLLARPDGGFVACFGDDARRGTVVVGCSTLSRTGRVGPTRIVSRRPATERPTFQAVAAADGRVVLLTSRRTGPGARTLRTTIVDRSGRVRSSRGLAEVPASSVPMLAATADGRTTVAWSTGAAGARVVVLRTMAPGADRFGPAEPFTPAPRTAGDVVLRGGSSLLVSYAVTDDHQTHVVRRLADGSFGPALRLPGVGRGAQGDEAVVLPLSDGSPFALTSALRGSDDDCGGLVRGVVGAGPLVAPGAADPAVRLSTTRQIAVPAGAAALSGGGVVAAWRNLDGPSGAARVEVAVRPAGATTFARPQVLARLAARDVVLASAGRHAALAWITGSLPDGPSRLVVSGLRPRAPYATAARRPTDPGAPCA